MNQYTQEQSILYVNKLKGQQLAASEDSQQHEAPPMPQPQRGFHLVTKIAHWLQSTLPKNVRYLHQRSDEVGR